jgi:hypothetical protein
MSVLRELQMQPSDIPGVALVLVLIALLLRWELDATDKPSVVSSNKIVLPSWLRDLSLFSLLFSCNHAGGGGEEVHEGFGPCVVALQKGLHGAVAGSEISAVSSPSTLIVESRLSLARSPMICIFLSLLSCQHQVIINLQATVPSRGPFSYNVVCSLHSDPSG